MKNNRYLYLIVLGYFMLGLVNIHFALLGLICMSIPFILLFKNTQKTWCQGYCPRASLLNKVGKSRLGRSKASPKFFSRGNMKWIMLIYFGISLTFISLSTLRVATNRTFGYGTLADPFILSFLFDDADHHTDRLSPLSAL
jgi:hypothetical protein